MQKVAQTLNAEEVNSMDKNSIKSVILQIVKEEPSAFIEVFKESVLPVLTKKYPLIKYVVDNCQEEYNNYMANQELIAKNTVNSLQIVIPNASVKKEYAHTLSFEGIKVTDLKLVCPEETGITVVEAEDGQHFSLCGTPKTAGTFELTLSYKYEGWTEDRPVLERKLPIIINPDPRDLWRNEPTDKNIPYYKEDVDMDYVTVEASEQGGPQKDIVAASKRGRSHAHEGKARDDHFKVTHLENGWYVMAVADGAGSAKYSREGSRIACETVTTHCVEALENGQSFEEAIQLWHVDEASQDAGRLITTNVYNILAVAAHKAQQAIKMEAQARQAEEPNVLVKHYATTLLLTICKKYDFGWFVASFWVGDGAICLYDKERRIAKLLGQPDEGEFAGQTRFLTMPEIFKDSTEIMSRLRFSIVDDFTALFLMTDGVSDPKFETDANLAKVEKWDELWDNLQNDEEHPVELTDDNKESAQQLLDWLDFWSPGNHDDRTIAILY